MPEKFFSLEQADQMLPQIERWLRTAVESKQNIAEIEAEYAKLVERVSMSGGGLVQVSHVARRKKELEDWTAHLQGAAEEIENCGCLLKDLQMGLVDFPCQIDGQEVYLCWKLGEPSIRFWHNTDEGFANRKPIDDRFLENLDNPRPM